MDHHLIDIKFSIFQLNNYYAKQVLMMMSGAVDLHLMDNTLLVLMTTKFLLTMLMELRGGNIVIVKRFIGSNGLLIQPT